MDKGYLSNENFVRLDDVIEEHKEKRGALMPVLHEAQKIFGCLSLEVQQKISEKMSVPLSEIYGVVTFYSQFTLEPKGKYTIGVCLGTACYVRGSQAIVDKVTELTGVEVGKTSPDGKFSLEATRCIGACGLAPVLTVNEEVYGRLTVEDIPGILAKY
ncbi:NADH-quinone oxidoreductase subunit NuoE family protein [Alkaliphilus sp. B6464]|uniref:NADH-quinone oxidoreductase subunit NuoE family protein n=1 Tax=Alkaliphilus sp. B6464 TaxID=2731219 RepID=UPI001BAAFE03|nr:NAD(P)H-dependent oxidoreductase subunit E [Alkaliphilus sp. B6464]QUH18722.1 NAD(P)H-dependent oxidoreductase subunit E [Alkaliphilus sp. B6464]